MKSSDIKIGQRVTVEGTIAALDDDGWQITIRDGSLPPIGTFYFSDASSIQLAMQDARDSKPESANVKCEFCDSLASFIIKRCAVCYTHRSVPLEHAESMGNR